MKSFVEKSIVHLKLQNYLKCLCPEKIYCSEGGKKFENIGSVY